MLAGALEWLDTDDAAPPATFLFVGNRPPADQDDYEREIHARLDALGQRITVVRAGLVPNAQMQLLYPRCALCVLPSLMEATSITGLEAMASGLPLVGTRVGGIPELIDEGTTGLLCDRERPEQLAACLAELLAAPDRCAAMGRAARDRAQSQFPWPVIAARFVKVYQQAVRERHS